MSPLQSGSANSDYIQTLKKIKNNNQVEARSNGCEHAWN